MAFLGDIISYLSYFFVLIIFLILAIICVKKPLAWILYSIGSIITLISLLGMQNKYESYYYNHYIYCDSDYVKKMMAPYWTIYIVLLIITAILIFIRQSKNKQKIKKQFNRTKHSNQKHR